MSLNLHRRHLDDSQRQLVGAKIANLKHGQRADYTDAQTCASVTQSDAAEMMNVSRRGVQMARTVLDSGAPEVVRIGQLLGRVDERQRTDLDPALSQASDSLDKDERHRFRKLAEHADVVERGGTGPQWKE